MLGGKSTAVIASGRNRLGKGEGGEQGKKKWGKNLQGRGEEKGRIEGLHAVSKGARPACFPANADSRRACRCGKQVLLRGPPEAGCSSSE